MLAAGNNGAVKRGHKYLFETLMPIIFRFIPRRGIAGSHDNLIMPFLIWEIQKILTDADARALTAYIFV